MRMTRRWIGVALGCALASGTMAGKEVYDFNDFEDGPAAHQFKWWSNRGVVAKDTFLIMDGVGKLGVADDKALVINKAEKPVKLICPDAMAWNPGETYRVEYDFKLGLSPGHTPKEASIMTLLIGDEKLGANRWMLDMTIRTNGQWVIKGRVPSTENVGAFVPSTFVSRNPTGIALSEWFHLSFTATKGTAADKVQSELVITGPSGETITTRKFKNNPLPDASKPPLHQLPKLTAGFLAKGNPNGLVCIDNFRVSSAPAAKPGN